jgi:hypothetical protein
MEKASMSGRRDYGVFLLNLVVIIILVFLTNVPLLYGYLTQHPHLKFMGLVAGVRDTNFYFMMMNQGDGWRPFLKNYFATGEGNIIYHGFFWFVLGKIRSIIGAGNLAVFHGARIAVTILFVPVAYWFVSKFLDSKAERAAALAMLSFGAGAGWLYVIVRGRAGLAAFAPADLGTPEASSFFTLMTFPHIALSLVLIVACLGLAMASISERNMWLAVFGGLCGMVLGFVHAVNLVVIFVVLGTFAIASIAISKDRSSIRPIIIFGGLSIWPIAYYLYLMLAKSDVLPQAPVRSPAPLAYLIGFAPLIILGLVRIFALIGKRTLPRSDLFLLCWTVSNFLLLYSYPLLQQEGRVVLGLQAPLVVLSTRAIFGTIIPSIESARGGVEQHRGRLRAAFVAVLIVAFTFPSTAVIVADRVSRLRDHPEVFSLTSDEYGALEFLRDAPGGGVVLSSNWIGNYLPRLTNKRSWLGLYDLPSHDSRLSLAKRFFAAETPSPARYDFLKKNTIGYIYYGPDERELGGFDPNRTPFLRRIFHNDSVDLYRFEPGDMSNKEPHAL